MIHVLQIPESPIICIKGITGTFQRSSTNWFHNLISSLRFSFFATFRWTTIWETCYGSLATNHWPMKINQLFWMQFIFDNFPANWTCIPWQPRVCNNTNTIYAHNVSVQNCNMNRNSVPVDIKQFYKINVSSQKAVFKLLKYYCLYIWWIVHACGMYGWKQSTLPTPYLW